MKVFPLEPLNKMLVLGNNKYFPLKRTIKVKKEEKRNDSFILLKLKDFTCIDIPVIIDIFQIRWETIWVKMKNKYYN